MSPQDRLARFYVIFIIGWCSVWLPLRYYTPLATPVRHTYQLPAAACVNSLTSDLWSLETVREGLFVLYILLPLSICFMLWSREKWAWGVHVVLLMLLFGWGLANLGLDINDIRTANVAPTDPSFRAENLARDPRWCLFWAGQPGTDLVCANPGMCAGPPVDPATFRMSIPFAMRFALNCFMIGWMVVDLWTVFKWGNLIVDQQPRVYKRR